MASDTTIWTPDTDAPGDLQNLLDAVASDLVQAHEEIVGEADSARAMAQEALDAASEVREVVEIADVPASSPAVVHRDRAGNDATRVLPDGTWAMGGALVGPAAYYDPAYAVQWWTATGTLLLGIRRADGTATGTLAAAWGAAAPPPTSGPDLSGTFWHIVVYGQSNAEGVETEAPGDAYGAAAALSTAPVAGLKMFAGGERPLDTADAAARYSSLVDHVARVSPDGLAGETPGRGAAEAVALALQARLGHTLASLGVTVLTSNAAKGSKTMAELSKGTPYFANLVNQIDQAHDRARGLGLAYRLLGVVHVQGENDQALGTPAATFKAQTKQFLADLDAEVLRITGKAATYPVVLGQIHNHRAPGFEDTPHAGHPAIALAQVELAMEAGSRFVLGGPLYAHPHADGGQSAVHLTAEGSRGLGGHLGLALFAAAIERAAPRPLVPVGASRSGATITLSFDLPTGRALGFDTSGTGVLNTTAPAGVHGFTLAAATGEAMGIESVAASGNTVTITAGGELPAGTIVRYATAGNVGAFGCTRADSPHGPLCDDEALTLPMPGTLSPRRLRRFAPLFHVTLD